MSASIFDCLLSATIAMGRGSNGQLRGKSAREETSLVEIFHEIL